MSLRWRLALVLAGTVAVTVAVVSVTAYVVARSELLAETDRALVDRATQVAGEVQRSLERPDGRGEREDPFGRRGRRPVDETDAAVQLLDADGDVLATTGAAAVPVDAAARAVAAGTAGGAASTTSVAGERGAPPVATTGVGFSDASVAGRPWRVVTVGLPGGGAVQAATDVTGTDEVLEGLRDRLLLLGLLGTLAAAGIGWLVARQTIGPVERLTAAAEHVAATHELHAAIPVDRTDEVGRLAVSFNEMLDALGQSQAQQQRLVQDASHELRTPLTSLRTNAEVLQQADRLSPEDRAKLLGDVTDELQELTDLVAELVLLAQSPEAAGEPDGEVELTALVTAVAERARRRTGRRIEVRAPLGPVVVRGRAAQLERALTNLMGNADKFSPAGTPIDLEVVVDPDGVTCTVRDRGPGIDPADRPHVFERFYRSEAARAAPGSGLGLSIVDQIARAHDGRVVIGDAPGGGAVVGLALPASRLVDTAASGGTGA